MLTPLVVCVPAHDEAGFLPRLLVALDAQREEGPVRVLVLANNCRDDTVRVARSAALDLPALELRLLEVDLPADQAHAGGARRTVMGAGAEWLRELTAEGGLLVSTDADALPPPEWLANTRRAFAAGADCVGGRIEAEDTPQLPLPEPMRRLHRRIQRYWDAVRLLANAIDPLPHDPPPRHGDHTGGSLAVTLAMHNACGGVPPLRTGEDRAFVDAIERQGGRLRHAPDVHVTVSARLDGRAEGGMAAEMRRWMAAGEAPYLLPSAAFWRMVAGRNRIIREGFSRPDAELAVALGLAPGLLAEAAATSRNEIAFVARVNAILPPMAAPEQEIEAAIAEMLRMPVSHIVAA